MTFVRKKNKTFKWPVVVREPSETDAGVYEENEFIAIFKRLKVSEYQKALEDKTEFEMLKMMLIGWENIKDLMEDADWIKAVSSAYTESLIGEKVKN